ncbi:uncharacterized protein LOC117339178 [Pecten maximus]|uniref:uncharacterized protein LOC117339178 n=1 Tax=Pecten maximus TaxID=6579 RepID=UPI0014581EC4|nr:uncharacterized protein LOC117339178 [Pecten maximus]
MERGKFKSRLPEAENDSDSNDVIFVNPTDHDGPSYEPTSRDLRLIKRGIKKPTMSAEDRNDQILRDAGIDTTGMSKQEKKEFVKVIMMSKDDGTPNSEKSGTSDTPSDAGNSSSSQNQHTDISAEPDPGAIYETHQYTGNEQSSTVHHLLPDDEDDKSRNRPQRTKILTGYSHRIGRHSRGDTKGEEDGETNKGWICSTKDNHLQQTLLVKDADVVENQKSKRGNGKRTTTQTKSFTEERLKKQRKMEQYSHIVIDDDEQNTASDKEPMEQRKSPQKISQTVMEDDDTQPPDSPEVFKMESPEESEEVRLINTLEEETTQDYFDGQQSEDYIQTLVPNSQATPPNEASDNVQHRLAGRTPPPRLFHQIHNSGVEPPTSRKASPSKSKNSSTSYSDKGFEANVPSETKGSFTIKTLKNKMVEMAHMVQNKFGHKSDKAGKGNTSGEPDITRKDSSSSQESDIYNVPTLIRHYRRAKKVTPRYPFYAPDPGSVQFYTKVIIQQLEIYSRKLTEVQTKAAEIIAWGEPVKCGRHAEKALDFAPVIRTRQNMYKEETSEEDDFVPYKPRTVLPRRHIKLKGSRSKVKDDPDYVPELTRSDDKGLYNTDTQPFGEKVEATMNEEIDLRDDSKPLISSSNQRQEGNDDTAVKTDNDGWMSVEKQKNIPRTQRGQQSGVNNESRRAAHAVTPQVQPVRRTMYTDIPSNPGAVKKADVYNLSDDNSGEEFLTLKKSGGNYKNRSTRYRHVNFQRKLLEKSDSGCSIENIPSDEENDYVENIGKFIRQKAPSPTSPGKLASPPYLQSESSMDSLSQQSGAMINTQGELYSTQICLQRERSAKKTKKTSPKGSQYLQYPRAWRNCN